MLLRHKIIEYVKACFESRVADFMTPEWNLTLSHLKTSCCACEAHKSLARIIVNP